MSIRLNLAAQRINQQKARAEVKVALGCLGSLVAIAATGFWYYLVYQILAAVNASPRMWIAYWIYLPMSLIGHVIIEIAKHLPED